MNETLRVKQVLSGDTSAFGYFVETYQDMAMSIACRICGHVQEAEDVVQESFIKAYRNLHAFRNESKFSSWFYRIVYNTAITHSNTKLWLAHTDLIHAEGLETDDFDTEQQLTDAERAILVERTLSLMPQGDALLLTLYYMEEHTIKEVAEITGLNEPNVKIKLHRARKQFRAQFANLFR